MKNKVWVLPAALFPLLESIWEEPPPGLRYLAEVGEVFRLLRSESSLESDLMGLGGDVDVARGPLVVSAFGWEPPARSVHFVLSLMSVDEEGKVWPIDRVALEEAEILASEFGRLATKKLTPKWGEQGTHGLVWEDGSLDLGCRSAEEIEGQPWSGELPVGDGEPQLRRLIDDSLNLLDGLDMNQRRFDEGKPKLNLLWPHSFGFKPDLPNLALRRGWLAEYWSDSIELEGMAKLVGYRHSARSGFRRGVHVADAAIRSFWETDGVGVLVDRGLGSMLVSERAEEARYGLEQFDKIWEKAAFAIRADEPVSGMILCPNSNDPGLGLMFGAHVSGNGIPFDARVWDDKRLRNLRLHEVLARTLGG